MHPTSWHTTSTRVVGALIGIAWWASVVTAEVPSLNRPQPPAADLRAPSTATAWTVERPLSTNGRRPLARLVRNPNTSDGSPPYALTDQAGTIQRYVEPVPGIDLESYVGYAVIVRHDTGRTLLASQLELPGPDSDPGVPAQLVGEEPREEQRAVYNASSQRMESLFGRVMSPPAEAGRVLPAQYMQGSMPQMQGVMPQMQGSMPQMQGAMPQMQGAMQPVMIQQGGPMMMTPQGVVPFEAMDPSMAGGGWGGAYPPGAAPIYLDDPNACGPEGCSTGMPYSAQPMMMPGQPYQPCQTCPPAPCPPPCPPPPPPPRWSMWGDVLWLQPTGVDMAHAQQQNGIGGAGTVPFGLIGVADPDYDLGFRVGGQFRFSPTDAVFVEYAFFEGDAASSLVAPNIVGGGGAVGSLVHHPEASITASAGPVNATYDIEFQLGDAAYRYFVVCVPTNEVSVFFGARYGKLDQRFAQTGVFAGGQAGTIDTTTEIEFDGIGPMAGVTGEHLVGNSRYSIYGRALAAALTGEFRSHYRMFNSTTTTLLAESFWNDDRIVPMLDYELGIAWTGPKGRFRVAAGYMMSFWFNAVTTPVFVDAVQADNYVDVADTVAFDGLVGRVECRW
jgi:hypothetical protein